MINELTSHVKTGGVLAPDDVRRACEALLDESASLEVRADFLAALHERRETPEEIASFVEVLLGYAVPFPADASSCIDVCGTGGDRAGLFNVSTAVMFVAAACGARVVKHGNRGITSKSGGADVLEALGVRVDLPPDHAAAVLEEAGCCFLFAPHYHPAFKAVAPVRKLLAEQGRTSVFNMLGPLLNPARPGYQLAGVFDPDLLDTYAAVFEKLGRRCAWAVHGTGPDGMRLDEISPVGSTDVVSLDEGARGRFVIDPAALGIPPLDVAELAGGTAAENAGIISNILAGNLRRAPRAIVQLNAAAALVVAGVAADLTAAWMRAGEALDDGSARDILDRLRVAR
jgi:anthranilate phosphoribosyltransferase